VQKNISLSHMILREVQRSKLNTALCFCVILLATGLLIVMMTVSASSVDATRVYMKNMGFNLLITPENADPAQYQALDFTNADMPEENVDKLANSTVLAQHFVGKYQQTIQINGKTVVLTGVRAEKTTIGRPKKPMPTAYEVPPNQAYIGSAAAKSLNAAAGGMLNILGRDFEVGKILKARGAIPEDIRVFIQLSEAQTLLDAEGKINAIDALACQCPIDTEEIAAALRASIDEVLPGVQVEPYTDILTARHKQRDMMKRFEMFAVAIMLAASATAIWGLTYLNVRNRRPELGVFVALGIPGPRIALLFVGKVLLFSVTGSVAGCASGYMLAPAFVVTKIILLPSLSDIISIAVAAPVVAVIFSIPPIVAGLLQDPADLLREATQ